MIAPADLTDALLLELAMRSSDLNLACHAALERDRRGAERVCETAARLAPLLGLADPASMPLIDVAALDAGSTLGMPVCRVDDTIDDRELARLAAEDTPRAVIAQVALGQYQLAGRPPSPKAMDLARAYLASRASTAAVFAAVAQPERTETP
jgi:hypothetical protein